MDFRILGPLEVIDAGKTIEPGSPRQRTVLAMLLLDANHVIPVERLIEAVWDEEPPNTARGQVQICISALRRQLRTDGRERILLRRPGYTLELNNDCLDLHEFERHVAVARQALGLDDRVKARDEFRAGLAKWRGPALADVNSRLVHQSVAQLEERRLVALEECMACELALGAYPDLPGELMGWVKQYPLRERLRALLMSTLYMMGRQAEALEQYMDARNTIMEELGIEPSEELQSLQQAILRGERPHGAIDSAPARRPAERPEFQSPDSLPATIQDFTGRKHEVGHIVDGMTLEQPGADAELAVRIGIITGEGGIGKTTLAVHAAHILTAQFPDGQLFAHLRSGDSHVGPAHILERFLRLLGVPVQAIPVPLEERAEMYRSLLAKRRMLIVLDDAISEPQVKPLLPGAPSCAVIITSRKRLTGIPVTSRIELGSFTDEDTADFLARVVGHARIDAELEAVELISRLCANLPIAMRIVAARLAARPHCKVADLAARLLDDSRRLDELDHQGAGVRASIWLTYKTLSPEARRLFRLLALLDVPSFSYWVAVPLMETDVLTAQDLMEELAEAFLIVVDPAPTAELTRYRFHDIMRSFARERLVAEEPAGDRHNAFQRLVGALLYLGRKAHRMEYGGAFTTRQSGAAEWPLPESLVEQLISDPLTWYEAERCTIVSVVVQSAASNLVEHAWDLALHAVTLFESHAYYDDWRTTHEAALEAACQANDRNGEAAMRYSLGSLYMFQQSNDEAGRQLTRAHDIYAELGDRLGIAFSLRNIAYLDKVNGNLALALARWEQSLGTLDAFGDQVAMAHVLHNMAGAHLDLGNADVAHEYLTRADAICRNLGNRRVGAQVLHRFGQLHLLRGEYGLAKDAYNRVLAAVRETADKAGECHALLGLAFASLRLHDVPSSIRALAEAEEIASIVGEHLVAGRVAMVRAELGLYTRQFEEAARYCDQAITCFRDLKAGILQAEALSLRGRIHLMAGRPEAAAAAWRAGHSLISTLDPTGELRISRDLGLHLGNHGR